MSEKVTIEAELVGTEQVNAGFASMQQSSRNMSRNMRQLSTDITIFGTATSGVANLAEAFGVLNDEQAKAVYLLGSIMTVGSSVIRVMNMMTSATVANTAAQISAAIATKARAAALAVMHALSGPYGWAILAGAAATATGGLALVNQIPERHTGGPVLESGPHNLLAGEYVLSREQVNNVSNMGGVTINVYEGSTANVMDALRRAGIK